MITVKVAPILKYGLDLADIVIYLVKQSLQIGAGNQSSFNQETAFKDNNSDREYHTEFPNVYYTEVVRRIQKDYLNLPIKQKNRGNSIRQSALTARFFRAGNCGEHADLAYVLCRDFFSSGWAVARVSSRAVDHAFVLVWPGTPQSEPPVTKYYHTSNCYLTHAVIAIDAWVTSPQAVLWPHYFLAKNAYNPNMKFKENAPLRADHEKSGKSKNILSPEAAHTAASSVRPLTANKNYCLQYNKPTLLAAPKYKPIVEYLNQSLPNVKQKIFQAINDHPDNEITKYTITDKSTQETQIVEKAKLQEWFNAHSLADIKRFNDKYEYSKNPITKADDIRKTQYDHASVTWVKDKIGSSQFNYVC